MTHQTTKKTMILLLLRQGKGTRQIAKEARTTRSYVYFTAQDAGVTIPRQYVKRNSGKIKLRQRLCKKTGKVYLDGYLPISGLRAIGVTDDAREICWKVRGNTLLITPAKEK